MLKYMPEKPKLTQGFSLFINLYMLKLAYRCEISLYRFSLFINLYMLKF